MKENKYNSMARFLIIVLNVLIAFGVLTFISLIISTLTSGDIGAVNRKYEE
ncbi:hypothetical protein [Clostridium sp. BJN0013]|uniref:hypothetical protein n=1 Tax=Clostridium sp. BJN0013 TaxID=3236840 RepID=UPI0034C5D17A